jgi:hypothetical protein
VKLKQAPRVIIPQLACWQRYAGSYLGGYLHDFGNTGFDLERSKLLCSQNAQCGGVTRQFDVHSGMLWTLRLSREPSALPDTQPPFCLQDTCESWVYLRNEASVSCTTHAQELDRTGSATVRITVSDGTYNISVDFHIHVMHPPFRLHSRISIFAAAPDEVSTVENAAFGLWRAPCVVVPRVVGRSVFAAQNADGQLHCTESLPHGFRKCHCRAYSATPPHFLVTVDNENLTRNSTMTINGTLSLPASDVPFLSGLTSLHVVLMDGDDAPYQASAILDVRFVNQAPTFSSRSITILENINCRAQEGWDILNANLSSAAPVACVHAVENVTWAISAGPFPELCINCGLEQASCNYSNFLLSGSSCEHQHVTFRVEHVSDATMFQTYPNLSVTGTLTFALWPEVSGEAQIALRLIDDGGYNAVLNPRLESDDVFERQCSTTRVISCGPASGPAQRARDNGTDVSELVFVNVSILPVNQQPSMVLDRQVSCEQAHISACMCPGPAAAFQQTSICAANGNELASITVLENSGLHHVHAFVRQISAGGGVPNEMAIFSFQKDPNSNVSSIQADLPERDEIRFEEMRPDPQGALKGLEAAADFAASPDGAHAYVAEFESSTLAVLDYSKGEEGIRLLDRRADGENRVRFHSSKTFATDNPCSASVTELQNQTFLALMQGCEVLLQNLEHFPSYREGDAFLSDPKSEEYGYLGNHTVGYWKFTSLWMRGLYSKPKQALDTNYPCSTGTTTEHMTYINPGGVIDIAGTFPPAYMDTDQCRRDSYQDTVAGEQPSLLTYMMNDGVNEVLSFDGRLLPALWISRNVTELEKLFPKEQISVEVWFTIEFNIVDGKPPVDPDTEQVVDNGGLLCASDRFTGWDLYYSVGEITSSGKASVAISWAISLEGTVDPPSTDFKVAVARIKNFEFRTWYHVVGTYDGTHSKVYVNGQLAITQKTCATGPSPPEVKQSSIDPCRMRMPQQADGRDPGNFMIGAGSMESSNFKPHFGQIASVRILDVAMTDDAASAGYNLRNHSLKNKIPVDTYWTKAYGGGLIPSPSTFHADSMKGTPVSLMGRFHMDRNYTCRWAHLDNFADSHATSNYAVSLDSSSPDDPIRMCETRSGSPSCLETEKDREYKAYENIIFKDKVYHNQLTCNTPRWSYGYKAAILSVIEESDTHGRLVLWQRTCVRRDTCGFINYIQIPGYFDSTNVIRHRPLWYLSGQFLQGVSLRQRHSFAQNRGDFTYFTFTVSSFLQHLDDGGAFTNLIVPLPTNVVLGASNVEFFRVSDSDDTLMAVANYWDGLSTHTNSIVARLDVHQYAETSALLQNPATLLQSIPTQGATGFAHISLTFHEQDSITRSYDYLAVSNYGGKTKIYRWSSAGSVLAINIARRGFGYIPGIIRILSADGAGFAGYTDPSDLQLFRGKDAPYAAYNFTGGQLVCNANAGAECARIVSHGSGFVADTSLPTSVADSQLAQSDLKCTVTGCNPLRKDSNCSISQNPVCNSIKVRGVVDVYYGAGCADDDTACSDTRMSDSITKMTVLRGHPTLPGHTHKCFLPGTIFHNNSEQQNSKSLRVDYQVDPFTGSIRNASFPDAASHGTMYYHDPTVTLSDGACRCGTTITSLEVIFGGQGYTSGTMTMSGSPTKQISALGSEFLAHFLAKGNVTEIQVLDSAIGFTSAPRVRIANDNQRNPPGEHGTDAQAIAILKLHSIILLTPGPTYLHQPTVVIEAPETVGGRRAEAEAVMELAVNTKNTHKLVANTTSIQRYRILRVVVTDPGWGYTVLPRIFFIDHPEEDSQMGTYKASAMAVLQVDKVMVNHDYSKYT